MISYSCDRCFKEIPRETYRHKKQAYMEGPGPTKVLLPAMERGHFANDELRQVRWQEFHLCQACEDSLREWTDGLRRT